jgi:hypothetical protein
MKRILVGAWASAFVAACGWAGPGLSAQKPKPDAGCQVAGATSAPTTRGADDEAIPKVLLDAARNSFVVVQVWYQKDTSDLADIHDRDWRIRRLYDEYIDKKRPEERVGVVLNADGDILAADDGIEDRFIEKIVVQDISGAAFPAKRSRLLLDSPGALLKVDAAAARKLKPLEFADLKDSGLSTRLLQAMLIRADDQWHIQVRPVTPAVRYAPGTVDNVFYGAHSIIRRRPDEENSPAILADANGTPVGCAAAPFMDLRQKECIWRGADLLKAEGLNWSDWTAVQERIRKQWIDATREIVITLRQSGAGEEEYGPPRSRYGAPSGAEGREVSLYGVAISPEHILVPAALNREVAAAIDKITVKFSATDRRKAEFVGAYKGFGAFVVRLPGDKLPAYVKPARQDLPFMKPFLAAGTRKRFGDKYIDLTANRLFGKTRGYEGKFNWYAARDMAPGSFLVDFEGNLAGLYVRERFENEEERQIGRTDRYGSSEQQNRIFAISEIREDLADPNSHKDPEIAVKSRTEAKRRPWFGVEFVPMTSELAEHFKVEKPTKDGDLGFVVNAVYPNSPAARFGVQVGDILLKIEAASLPSPIELASRLISEGGDYRPSRRYGGYTGDEEESEEEMGPVEPTWKSRRSFLTFALDKIKIGRKITLTCYRPDGKGGGEVKKIDYAIEQAPVDFDSAPKWKNAKLGLTVKDVTYEIRYALGLKNDDPGLIVGNIEPGSPARVARIYPNEIITRLNDEPLRSAKQMCELVAKAKKAGQAKVRLTILRLGKTRFADLAVGAYDPAEDEGLNED